MIVYPTDDTSLVNAVKSLKLLSGSDEVAVNMDQDISGNSIVEMEDALLHLQDQYDKSGPSVYYYINDHLSTGQLVTDKDGLVVWQGDFRPFGEVDVVVNQVENRLRFPGQYYDSETGLHYNWHRFYDPSTGRYISADPIGLEGDINLYTYTGGNPINWIDPYGLMMLKELEKNKDNPTPNGTSGLGQIVTKCIEFEQLKWLVAKGIWYVILNESCEEDCDGDIEKGKTKDGEPRVKVMFPDSDKVKKDITEDRVKEWELEPRNPKDGRKRKEFDGTEPTKKWPNDKKKRAPRPHEIDLLKR